MLQRTFSSQLLFCSFFLFVTRIQSEEILQLDAIDADNVTNIDNQTCEAKVNTYMFKMMVENFNETTPEIEEKVINRTKLMLEEEYLPELSLELHSNLSIELKRETNAVEDRLKIILNEKDEEIQELKAKVDTLETGSKRSLETLEANQVKLNTEIRRIEDECKAAIDKKNVEISDLKNQNVALETKTNQLEGTSTKLRSDIDRVESVVDQHTGQISTLVTKTKNLEESTLKRNCKNANMVDTKENCDLTHSPCGDGGCPLSDTLLNCVDSNTNDEFVLMCSRIRPSRQCIMTITSQGMRCRSCCRNANCGGNLPTCKMYK